MYLLMELFVGINSIARKKKTERMVPPINNSNYLNQSSNNGGGIYSNHVTPNMIHGSNGGITNQAYSRDARYVNKFKYPHNQTRL